MSENTTAITSPTTWIGGRRQARSTTYLRPSANLALGAWEDRARDAEGIAPNAQEAAGEAAAAAVAARLIAADPIAQRLVTYAATLPLPRSDADYDRARYAAAADLVAEQNRIDPVSAPASHGQDDAVDTCRHGKTFTAACRECDAEFA